MDAGCGFRRYGPESPCSRARGEGVGATRRCTRMHRLAGVLLLVAGGLVAAQAPAQTPGKGAEPSFTVLGACRDGVPNGLYELRGRNGMLRVLGAFHAGRRTGTFIFWNATGGRLAAIPYDEDVRNGTIALWHVGERTAREIGRKLEAPVRSGRAAGTRRTWHRNGTPRTEAEYVRGEVTAVRAWDAAGRELPPAGAARIEKETFEESERYLASLESLVKEHRPDCTSGSGPTRGGL